MEEELRDVEADRWPYCRVIDDFKYLYLYGIHRQSTRSVAAKRLVERLVVARRNKAFSLANQQIPFAT